MGAYTQKPDFFDDVAIKMNEEGVLTVNSLVKYFGLSSPFPVKRWLSELNININKTNRTIIEECGNDIHNDLLSGLYIEDIVKKYKVSKRRLVNYCRVNSIAFKSIKDKTFMPEKEELRYLHHNKKYTKRDLAKHYNVQIAKITQWLKEHNIEYRSINNNRKPSKEFLEYLHYNKKYTKYRISEILGVGKQYVNEWFKYYGIEDNKDAQKYPKKQKKLGNDDTILRSQLIKMNHDEKKTLKEIANHYNVTDVLISQTFRNLGIEVQENYVQANVSKDEKELIDFIRKYYSKSKSTKKVLNGLQIDCYIEELSLGIEYDGLYWHSEIYLDKDYHLKKTKLCKERGIRLIHLFEDEWLERREIVESMLLNILNKSERIYARNCVFSEIHNKKEVMDFLNKNHLQGRPNSYKYAFGLYYNNELVEVMTYGIHHRSSEKSLVLNRMCTKINTSVVGGSSKLFKHSSRILKKHGHDKIVTWSDNRWSEGDVYNKMGFVVDKELPIDYYYVKSQKRYNKQKFQKKKIGCPDDITEYEYMKSLGFNRIWDCGKKRWICRF